MNSLHPQSAKQSAKQSSKSNQSHQKKHGALLLIASVLVGMVSGYLVTNASLTVQSSLRNMIIVAQRFFITTDSLTPRADRSNIALSVNEAGQSTFLANGDVTIKDFVTGLSGQQNFVLVTADDQGRLMLNQLQLGHLSGDMELGGVWSRSVSNPANIYYNRGPVGINQTSFFGAAMEVSGSALIGNTAAGRLALLPGSSNPASASLSWSAGQPSINAQAGRTVSLNSNGTLGLTNTTVALGQGDATQGSALFFIGDGRVQSSNLTGGALSRLLVRSANPSTSGQLRVMNQSQFLQYISSTVDDNDRVVSGNTLYLHPSRTRVGVGTSVVQTGMVISSTLTIRGGTPGTGKVLVAIDSGGTAVWSSMNCPGVQIFNGFNPDGTIKCQASCTPVVNGSCGPATDGRFIITDKTAGCVGTVGNTSIGSASNGTKCLTPGSSGFTQELCANGTPSVLVSQVTAGYGSFASGFNSLGSRFMWTWTCNNTGGTAVSCTAVNANAGICGSANGTTNANWPADATLCNFGTIADKRVQGTQYLRSCTPRGVIASCSATIPPVPINGSCGVSNGQSFSSTPTSNLCAIGAASSVTQSASTYSRSCAGIGGGGAASCSATRSCSAPTSWTACNGVCGGGAGSQGGYDSCGNYAQQSCINSAACVTCNAGELVSRTCFADDGTASVVRKNSDCSTSVTYEFDYSCVVYGGGGGGGTYCPTSYQYCGSCSSNSIDINGCKITSSSDGTMIIPPFYPNPCNGVHGLSYERTEPVCNVSYSQ